MKFNKKFILNNDIYFNFEVLQNKQLKDNLIYKRYMFTKGVSKVNNLKKSGDIIYITKDNESKLIIDSKLKSLDLACNSIKQQQLLNSSITVSVAVKNISTGDTSPIQVNRYLASYGKLNKKYSIEWKQNNKKIEFNEIKRIRIEDAIQAYNEKKISKEQYNVFFQRWNALDKSYVHSTIMDIIEEDEVYVTIIYHVITTSFKEVDYGGPNKFEPLFLYHDSIKNKDFYTIPLTYLHKLPRQDYINYFESKRDEILKIDGIELQRELACSIRKIHDNTVFKLLDINKNCIDLPIVDINPNELFPYSKYGDFITGWINYLNSI